MLWWVTDILNFVSVFLNKSMLTQILLGTVWLTMSSLMLLQLVIFNVIQKKKNMNESADVSFKKLEIAIYIGILLVVITNMGSYAVPLVSHMKS